MLATLAAASALILFVNAWWLSRGHDVLVEALTLVRPSDAQQRATVVTAFGKLLVAAIVIGLATRLVRRGLIAAERSINRWDRIQRNNRTLAALVAGLNRLTVTAGWLLLLILASMWLAFPASVTATLTLIARLYLLIVAGVLIIRASSVIVDTLDGWSERSAQRRGWNTYYERLRPLRATFRVCLDYALWIGLASLAFYQIERTGYLAAWGPRLIHGLGLFFAGRVLVELGSFEIVNRMLPARGLSSADRQRRETMIPLVRTAYTYAVYFATAVLILGALGFNPMPFLAGAGILGLVIGFGAQSLINDVVSGFFILFENVFLVGDVVEIGPAKGVVETIDFRTTKIRDADGRVHVIRNGDLKPIINYSKDYTRAVIAVEVSYDADLRRVFGVLRDAGERLRAENPNTVADLEIGGITSFGPQSMTVRASARVSPGCHDSVAAELRLLINEMFNRQAGGSPRRSLIPSSTSTH